MLHIESVEKEYNEDIKIIFSSEHTDVLTIILDHDEAWELKKEITRLLGFKKDK